MAIYTRIKVDGNMKNVPIGGMFESCNYTGRIYIRNTSSTYLVLKPTAIGQYVIVSRGNHNLSATTYKMIVDDKKRKKYIDVILDQGYQPQQETIYVKPR